MTSSISTISKTDQRPALQTPELHRLLGRLTNAVAVNGTDHNSISSQSAPTVGERRALEERRNLVVDALRPASGARDGALALAERILRMFYAWPTVRLDEDKALGVAQTYAEQVESFPMWAVVAAIAECQARKIPFPPSAGELRAACQAKVQPYHDEMAGLRRVLEAEVFTPTKHGEDAIKVVRELAATWKSKGENPCW